MAYIVYCQKTIGFVREWTQYAERPTLREAEYVVRDKEAEGGYNYKIEPKAITP